MEIHFEIENKCLLRCKHCSSYASEYGKQLKYTPEQMIDFLNSIAGKKSVYLTGGEPMLYPEILSLLEKIQQHVEDVTLGMFTTGTVEEQGVIRSISKEWAEKLRKAGLSICYLSLYSIEEKQHDWMTGINGSFKILKNNIQALQVAGIRIRLNVVVTRFNYKNIPEIIQLAKQWKVSEVRLLKLICHGRAAKCWEKIGISEKEYYMSVSTILEQKWDGISITASGMENVVPCRDYCKVGECPAGKKLWYITFEGNVYPCASVKNNENYRIGNISERGILENVKKYQKRVMRGRLCVNFEKGA